MKALLGLVLGAMVAFGFYACSDDSDDTATTASGSCTLSAGDDPSLCLEYNALAQAVITTAQSSCEENTSFTGTWATTTCATTNSVGTCAYTNDGTPYNEVYYSDTFTAATAESSCTDDGGTFTAATLR